MERKAAEQVMNGMLGPVYAFARRRCASLQDAEDLSQEIVYRAFRGLLRQETIERPEKFVWTVAHNALSNYYRDKQRTFIGVPVEEMAEVLPSGEDIAARCEQDESAKRLRAEIAYLSKIQRKIVVARYYENKKQETIARELGLPLGTVKWHLFEIKKELKKGMTTMRSSSDLKFNPIRFKDVGINGSVGTTPPDSFFRTALSQNVAYCVRHTPKTVSEIADDLGVSPVFVESEAEYLTEYGLLKEEKGRYLINFCLSEPTVESVTAIDRIYRQAAELFANDLYDELTASAILDDPSIWCAQSDEPLTLQTQVPQDRNFLLWTLIPWIAAWSGEKLVDSSISFDEVATIRPDGAQNIFHASVYPEDLERQLPADCVQMKRWCGPAWNGTSSHILWQVDSEWSEKRIRSDKSYHMDAMRVLALYERSLSENLSEEEYVWLAERGLIKMCGTLDDQFRASWQIISLASADIRDRLLAVGERVKARHRAKLDALRNEMTQIDLAGVPDHLRPAYMYEAQHVFHSDGRFLCHCLHTLLANGKLKLPTAGQRQALTTLIWRSV